MNIKLPYYASDTIGDVTLILRNRALEDIGNVVFFTDFNCKVNMNSADEMSFTVHKYMDGELNPYWNKITDLRVIYNEELNENFVASVTIEEGSEGDIKNVVCTSLCEDELSNIRLYNIGINTEEDILREDYVIPTTFYNPNVKTASLLHRLLDKAPHYYIGHVDDSLKRLQRTFSFDGTSIYDALMQVSEAIGCIFIFDSITRTINAYDLKNVCLDCGHRFEYNYDKCPKCNGTGAKNPNDVQTCTRCNGAGRIRVQQRTAFGNFVQETACPECNGIGTKMEMDPDLIVPNKKLTISLLKVAFL